MYKRERELTGLDAFRIDFWCLDIRLSCPVHRSSSSNLNYTLLYCTMSKKGQSKNDLKNLTYIPQKPAFLQTFGQPKRPSPPPGRSGASRSGREALPERPTDGEWAEGSDDETRGKGKGRGDSDDEWGDVYGGGGDDGPQVVVLKEGRHLTAEDVKRERRRGAFLFQRFKGYSS